MKEARHLSRAILMSEYAEQVRQTSRESQATLQANFQESIQMELPDEPPEAQ
jgi:hypothetical protein